MKPRPTETEVAAWIRLMRASGHVLAAIETDLKKADFPPLSWYDVLLELKREPGGALRPADIEKRTLLAQYNVSRLIDRLETAGYVTKRKSRSDGRSVVVIITDSGVELLTTMWPAYAEALDRHFSGKLGPGDAEGLAKLLGLLLPER